MKRRYLHLSTYSCDKCSGPVVSGFIAARENEISKETEIRQVGAICISCGHRQNKATEPGRARHMPQIEWGRLGAIYAGHPPNTFVQAGSIVQNYIEQGATNLQTTVVVNETQLPDPVHEEAHSRTSGANHLG
jgi:hypothetical protein